MIKVGIIGYGYWGPNLLRNFMGQKDATVIKVSDKRPERRELAQRSYPTVTAVEDGLDVINDKEIDAVAIATPVDTHFEIAKACLLSGKHVVVEKPMTFSIAESEELVRIAENEGKVLMCDHTFLYTGAVQKIKQLVDNGDLGTIQYFDSTRINLGLFQHDVNVLWDLAPHDISILLHLVDKKPISVQATGISHTSNGLENIAYMTVNFEGGNLIAHFNCSWISPVKLRNTLIGGDKKMVLYNDMEPTEKVKVYDTGFKINSAEEQYKLNVEYRVGDIYVPKVPFTEALSAMAADFIQAINTGSKPVADMYLGRDVVKILEASQKSIKNKGTEVEI